MDNFKDKISVLLPFYGDRGYLKEAILSVINQDYPHWELIAIDDGSPQDFSDFINSFNDARIKYLKAPHGGQLRALEFGASKLDGDFVTLLHSDDRLAPQAFSKILSVFRNNEIDGVFADLMTIDEEGRLRGRLKTSDRLDNLKGVELFLRLGSNMLSDVFFLRRAVFEKWVRKNYLSKNLVYWWDYEKMEPALKLKKISPYYFYRQYSGNYRKSEIGTFVAVMGSLRSCLKLAQKISVPAFFFQRYFWLGPVKIFPFLSNFWHFIFHPFYRKKPTSFSFQLKIVRFSWSRFFGVKWPSNLYFSALRQYLKNAGRKEKKVFIDLEGAEVLTGKDEVNFYHWLQEGNLPYPYQTILEALKNGATILETQPEKHHLLVEIFEFLNFPFPSKS